MGAGVATGFRERYPEMYGEYRRRCKAQPREFNLGDAWLWKDDEKPWVFNLATQEGVWRARASYQAIEAALTSMREQADREGVRSIAIPRIGAGHGGLSPPAKPARMPGCSGSHPSTGSRGTGGDSLDQLRSSGFHL